MTRSLRLAGVAAICSALLTGCTYVAAVSQTNVPAERSKLVRASSKRFMVLFFNFDNDYPYKLVSALKSQCPDGRVRGVVTKDSYTLYFLHFFWQRQQEARGYCVSTKSKTAARSDEADMTAGQAPDKPVTAAVDQAFGTEIIEP